MQPFDHFQRVLAALTGSTCHLLLTVYYAAFILAQILGGVVGAGLIYALYFGAIDIFEGAGIRTAATAGIFATYPVRHFSVSLSLSLSLFPDVTRVCGTRVDAGLDSYAMPLGVRVGGFTPSFYGRKSAFVESIDVQAFSGTYLRVYILALHTFCLRRRFFRVFRKNG